MTPSERARRLGQIDGRRWVLWGAQPGTGNTLEQHMDAAWPAFLRVQDDDGSLYAAYLAAGCEAARQEPMPEAE